MPSLNAITPILGDNYYHIFNRGNNKECIFFTESNYNYFISLYKRYISPFCDTLAYCLIPNHFHLLIKIKGEILIEKNGEVQQIKDDEKIGATVSEQFRRLFITYSQAIKKQEKIIGNLFSRPFKRIMIEDEDYLKYLTFYIHFNPVKHNFSDDFKKYRFSSYSAIISNSETNLNRTLLLDIFGGREDFINYHNYYHDEKLDMMLE
jgi:REP element-mobilizing transposase RayT